MNQTFLINPTSFQADLEESFAARSRTNEAQAAAFARFSQTGLPNRRFEGWRWSDFNAVLRGAAPEGEAAPSADVRLSPFATLHPFEIRLVDGWVVLPAEVAPAGVRCGIINAVGTIPELEGHPIATLNVAMTRKALGIEVSEGVAVERPLLIRHINTGAGFTSAQTLLRIAKDARVKLIETYEGAGAGFYSHLFHTVVRDGAALDRIVLQETGAEAILHGMCAAKMEQDARFDQTALSTGSRLARHETHVHFWHEGATARLDSAALVAGARHSDFTSEIQFKDESCTARQCHKGVARDRGRNVFQGKFLVERGGQKTDAKMAANALLLSDEAEANHKPELEIYADDVECAHGSTVGALDEDALFYLRQRGLDEGQARALLVEAFLGEVIDNIEDEAARDIFRARIAKWQEG